ncbi:MAG: imidazolonepropionase-like amidohydrolase [Candidatus Paceibacteria bacterium]|jgi:imidazolonepropionase-like amidohydrolase
MIPMTKFNALSLALPLLLVAPLWASDGDSAQALSKQPASIAAAQASARASATPGEPGGRGLAILTAKALTVPLEGVQYIDNAVVLVKDGLIEAVGKASETPIPMGYEVLDVGSQWLSPGMVDLHSHVAGTWDINDMVYLANPGVRASTAVRPGSRLMKMGLAGGVTTILFIPGSGTNIGGQGILLKTGLDDFDATVVRNPGSMKLAQAGNPERWMIRPGRTFMNWNTRNTLRRGVAYAKRFEEGAPGTVEKNLQFEIMRSLYKKEVQISTHTQIYQVANMTLTMVAKELGLPVFIDHGTFDAYKVAPRAMELGVSAILGPRNVSAPSSGMMRFAGSNPESIIGVAAGYQAAGMKMIGFNTDAPVIPQEELSLQASIGARYGFIDDELQTIRGLTIIPAKTAGIDHLVGSLEPGKHADILVTTGDPKDPRCSVEMVLTEGKKVYDVSAEARRW